jgi:NAD(P)-dependent dehydrogenase (short-subunit alcohol dehydrogenase family)
MMFDAKVAVVTGAASGIGEAVTRKLTIEGARVYGVDVAWSATAPPSGVVPLTCDITKEDQVEALFAQIHKEAGTIDLLFNNAGIGRGGCRLHDVTTKDFDDVLNVNVRGMFLVFRAAIRLMLTNGGAIVNTGSTASFMAPPFTGAYSMSKGAVLQFTKQAAQEYAQDGIRVNCVCPGATATPLLLGAPDDVREATIKAVPLRRLGTPEEISNVVTFLLSDEAAYVTGAAFVVDGGKITIAN